MILNVNHYNFFILKDVEAARLQFLERFEKYEKQVLGTVLIAKEGVNFSLAGPKSLNWDVDLLAWLQSIGADDFNFKKSYSAAVPFRFLKVKIKNEIVSMGTPDLNVPQLTGHHMPSAEWKKMLESPEEWLILDTRNDFEYEMGTFENAQKINMQQFRQFVSIADQWESTVPKDQKIAMFCTGGIRCEKASAYLRKKGFEKVHQLEGGILRYLEEQGGAGWKGQCFIFDDRVSVDPELNPEIDMDRTENEHPRRK